MATFFTGLGDRYSMPNKGGGGKKGPPPKIFIGVVLDICLNESSPLYQSPRDIGKIRVRLIPEQSEKLEDDCKYKAYPLDRSTPKYPLPGEQVILYVAQGESAEDTQKDKDTEFSIASVLYYGATINALHNATYNLYPYAGSAPTTISDNETLSTAQTDQRFDQKIENIDSYKNGNDIRIAKQLRPFEGDFILQGRFGNTIRFGSTVNDSGSPWSSAGAGGSGIMVLRVDRDNTTVEKDMLTVEDVNKDDSSIYICSSQQVALNLSCAKELKSWRARYGIPSTNGDGGTSASTIERTKDITTTWQKI